MLLFRQMFTWWHTQTLGSRLYTFLRGREVGTDEAGNRYYDAPRSGRRWVVYCGLVEATKVPPAWHAWLHHMSAAPPSVAPLPEQSWQKPHHPNMTGTEKATTPQGALHDKRQRAPAGGDYEAWRPE